MNLISYRRWFHW